MEISIIGMVITEADLALLSDAEFDKFWCNLGVIIRRRVMEQRGDVFRRISQTKYNDKCADCGKPIYVATYRKDGKPRYCRDCWRKNHHARESHLAKEKEPEPSLEVVMATDRRPFTRDDFIDVLKAVTRKIEPCPRCGGQLVDKSEEGLPKCLQCSYVKPKEVELVGSR